MKNKIFYTLFILLAGSLRMLEGREVQVIVKPGWLRVVSIRTSNSWDILSPPTVSDTVTAPIHIPQKLSIGVGYFQTDYAWEMAPILTGANVDSKESNAKISAEYNPFGSIGIVGSWKAGDTIHGLNGGPLFGKMGNIYETKQFSISLRLYPLDLLEIKLPFQIYLEGGFDYTDWWPELDSYRVTSSGSVYHYTFPGVISGDMWSPFCGVGVKIPTQIPHMSINFCFKLPSQVIQGDLNQIRIYHNGTVLDSQISSNPVDFSITQEKTFEAVLEYTFGD